MPNHVSAPSAPALAASSRSPALSRAICVRRPLERKRSEALLREQAALARLGEMTAVVAHEVKNSLAGIRGVLQVIGGRVSESRRDREIIADIVARLDSLSDIVEDLLVFARPREPRLAPVPLVDLLENNRRRAARDGAFQPAGQRGAGGGRDGHHPRRRHGGGRAVSDHDCG